ncbi:hypothetical protein LTR62_003225 [Meristemomyces frigidus]|uniref:GRAM domain-containing protein n=1 Tax=Meristemomyces frigidus TaxID=1508187 RepID=A0AAN7TFT0_9PEZI|nr:hypothetical protein LTR62_003225 [Meristemomyces frigidus]
MSATCTITTTSPLPTSPPRPNRLRSHLRSWVMLSPAATPPYTPLPNETTLLTSPPRIGFTIATPSHFPGKGQKPYTLTHASGVLYLTSRRIIYIPDKPTATFQSFAAPILNLHDSHVTAPFFGPNVWMALLQPTAGGGIPIPGTGVVELKLTFKDGGAFDFHTGFERVKERLAQAVEVGRMGSDGGASSAGNGGAVVMPNADLDDLPAYQEQSDGPLLSPVMVPQQHVVPVQPVAQSVSQRPHQDVIAVDDALERAVPEPVGSGMPDEPPPGYEEAQMQGLQEEVERRASGGQVSSEESPQVQALLSEESSAWRST